jgi:predicted protein tyrosine phosphatase
MVLRIHYQRGGTVQLRLTVMKSKVLFVCTANLQRSPTAEELFKDWQGKWETRSAGTDPVPGRTPITQELVNWADLVICMESEHVEFIKFHFKFPASKLKVLNVEDRYYRNDPELIAELQRRVPPILASYLK